jgi:methyl-accepting chemotaxis protein
MPKLDNQTVLIALIAVTGLVALLQAIILLAIFFTVRKAARTLREETGKLHTSLMPVLYEARDTIASARDILTSAQAFLAGAQGFVSRMTPKIEAAAADLEEMTHGLLVQTGQLQSSAQEILERVRRQGDRLEAMFSSLLDTVDRAGGFVTEVVSKPVRQVSGVLRAAKAVVESLRGSAEARRRQG